MAQKRIKWTDQQKRAITARGSDVFVAASAGTGKTAVLSGRCASIVSDKSVCPDVWSILVLTFTDAAAEQMRARIAEQLRLAFLQTADPHLRQQLLLLQAADISTIHAFCKRLITEYFYKLSLDPTFRVIDADEARLLEGEVLDKTIEWAWQQSNLVPALEQLLWRRDLRTNDGFLFKVIELSDFLDGVVSRQSWCDKASLLAEAANPSATDLGQKQKQIVADRLQHALGRLRHVDNICKNVGVEAGWSEKFQRTFIEPVKQCIETLQRGDWDACVQQVQMFRKSPRFYKPESLKQSIAELVSSTVKKATSALKDLNELAILNPDYLDRIGTGVSQQTRVFIELVKKFDQLYAQAKRSLNCLDFADLEHHALKLLSRTDPDIDELMPAETALMLRRKYKYIFVDEYQDINSVQQAILKMLSSKGNVFTVGDIKQSIYAFRGAEPEIFANDLQLASVDSENAPDGLRVDLNKNFRSAKGILDFVNAVFSRIMTSSFAKIDYDDSAKLRSARGAELAGQPSSGSEHVVEFHILDETDAKEDLQEEKSGDSGEEWDVISKRQRQAAFIAQQIRKMVGADSGESRLQIYDETQGCLRDVQYRDIVVLMRSLVRSANDYVEVFRLAGIPVSCQSTAGYFQTTEISDVIALLKILDNPQRDIELAAVLRSPLFNLSDTDLAKIRLHSKAKGYSTDFYNCVRQYCESAPDKALAYRLRDVLAQIEKWRTDARRGELAELIWQIYRQSGYLSIVSALPNGQARRANLLKLHDRAIQFEGFATSAATPSLTRFVRFIERLLETGQDWSPAEPENAAGNAVRILSVHKSKGLEFPVVFLAELQTAFNKRDINADIIADTDGTLGMQIIDRVSNSKLRSLAHEVVAEKKLSTALAEEMRILYVATTRAKDRLILISSEKKANCAHIITDGFFFGSNPISHWQLRDCQNPLQWLLYGLSNQKVLHDAFDTNLGRMAKDDGLFIFKLHGRAEIEKLSNYVLGLRSEKSPRKIQPLKSSFRKPAQTELLSRLKSSLAWSYRFANASLLPAKSSVTQLTHRGDEYVKFDYSQALDRQPAAFLGGKLFQVGPAAARLIGTATHIVISQLDLTGFITEKRIENTKKRLVAEGAIAEDIAEYVCTTSIMAFFDSELGQLVLDKRNVVRREWPFTFSLPASQWENLPLKMDVRYETRDTIIVQGVIDLLIRSQQGLVVIDFKTDNVTAAQVHERAQLYHQQLELYSKAASAIFNDRVVAEWLYFLTPCCAIQL
jgi:ATP-dependent helicase/nuclease subunit A